MGMQGMAGLETNDGPHHHASKQTSSSTRTAKRSTLPYGRQYSPSSYQLTSCISTALHGCHVNELHVLPTCTDVTSCENTAKFSRADHLYSAITGRCLDSKSGSSLFQAFSFDVYRDDAKCIVRYGQLATRMGCSPMACDSQLDGGTWLDNASELLSVILENLLHRPALRLCCGTH
ncbi:hypothetical protein BD309DRAFT_216642 [Dichomitus squalens]|nr:hypothetical protein BD309DRAFT_216642 [Dichomitus squalens]